MPQLTVVETEFLRLVMVESDLLVNFPLLHQIAESMHAQYIVSQAIPFAEKGRVWSCCNYRVVAEECNYPPLWLGNKMLTSAEHVT